MSASVPSPRTAAANAARQQQTQAKLQRVEDALKRIRREKTAVTYPAVARRADVSRTFLYTNTDARALMEAAQERRVTQRQQQHIEQDRQSEASWRERALNAEDGLKAAHTEIRNQRDRIGRLLGQLRDREHESDTETLQRLTTESTTLKQRVRQLTTDNRSLEERLQAARNNVRFADRRISQLEAQLLDINTDINTEPR